MNLSHCVHGHSSEVQYSEYLRVVEFAVLLSLSIQSVVKVLLTLIVPKVLCDTEIRRKVRL